MKCCLISLGACLFSACFNTCKSNTNDISISTRRPTSCQRPTVLSLCLNSFARCSFLFIPALLILNIMIFCISPETPDIVIVHFPEDYFEFRIYKTSLQPSHFLDLHLISNDFCWAMLYTSYYEKQSEIVYFRCDHNFQTFGLQSWCFFYSTFKTFNRLDTTHFT